MPQRQKIATVHPLLRDQKKLGRIAAIDFRDRNFRLTAPPLKQTERKWKYFYAPEVLDQGDTPQCVEYSTRTLLHAGPVVNRHVPYDDSPGSLYKECQLNDEWEGEDYEGTSVRASMKVTARANFIKEYHWAMSAEEALAHMLTSQNVVLFGTDWLNSMFSTKKYNAHAWIVVRKDSGLAGGHAYMSLGGSRTLKCPHGQLGAVQIQNTWGRTWGDGGRAFMCLHDLDDLIKANGECAISLEIKVPEVKAHKGLPTSEPVDMLQNIKREEA